MERPLLFVDVIYYSWDCRTCLMSFSRGAEAEVASYSSHTDVSIQTISQG